MFDLTGFQRDLLYAIAGLEKAYGLAIKDELEQYYEDEIHHGRLYPNLDALAEDGLLEKGKIDNRTNYYTLTDRGTEKVKQHLEWKQESINPEIDTS